MYRCQSGGGGRFLARSPQIGCWVPMRTTPRGTPRKEDEAVLQRQSGVNAYAAGDLAYSVKDPDLRRCRSMRRRSTWPGITILGFGSKSIDRRRPRYRTRDRISFMV